MKKTILVVDDEPEIVTIFTKRLTQHDYKVLASFDGQAALNEARSSKPDLILLDIMLPKVDGFKVCRILKFDSKFSDIPIIMVSALATQSDIKQGYAAGAQDYFIKPVESEALLSRIKELLPATS